MTKPTARRNALAFTLIEVLVTVVIIALLIAILMPSLGNARTQARTAACMSNLHQFGIAFDLYGQDNGQRSPLNVSEGTAASSYKDGDVWFQRHSVAKYVPADKLSLKTAGMLGVFACPAEPTAGRAYSMNTPGDRPVGQKDVLPFNPYTIKPAYRYLLLGEAHAIRLDPATGMYGTNPTIGGTPGAAPYDKFRTISQMADRGPFSGYINFARHHERSNFLLCDQSVRSLRTSQVVNDRLGRSCMEVWWLPEDLQLNPPAP